MKGDRYGEKSNPVFPRTPGKEAKLMMSLWNLFWIVPLAAGLGIILLAIVSGGPPDD